MTIIACAPKSEIIQDPIFEDNYIQFDEMGKTEIIQDPLFPENYLIFSEPRDEI